MELWDVLDGQGKPTGRTVPRGKLAHGDYHLAVHIWIQNDKNQLLVQQRADTVELMPGKWAVTGGSALAGEEALQAARRELAEELGIETKEDELQWMFRMKRQNAFQDVWLLKRNVKLGDITMQPSEVQAVKWVHIKELRQLVKKGKFHRYYYLDMLLNTLEEEI